MNPASTRTGRTLRLTLAATALLLALGCSGDEVLSPHSKGLPQSSTLPTGLTESLLANGLSSPTTMALMLDGRALVSEQCGTLRVVKSGALLPVPMLTLSVDCTGERGLLGVVADPNFATNSFIYVYYTVPAAPVHNRVSRFTVSGDVASPASEQVVLDLDALSADYHNGGGLHFGLDGTLFISAGDNGNSANAQVLTSVFGKMLRINADGSIPTDNPFYSSTTGTRRTIWAMGLRNPFTFAVQPGTGRMFIDDVGEDSFEEIDDGIAGSNYGWPTCEGRCQPSKPSFRDPLYTYSHSIGCAIAGGDFYNPVSVRFPASYVGKYFFADYCAGSISVFDPVALTAAGFASGLSFPVDLRVGVDGSLYYLQRGTTNNAGQLWRIDGATSQAPVVTQQPANILVSVGQPATFSISATGTAPLSYQWRRDGTAVSGATASSYTLASTVLADSGAIFTCVVSSPQGSTTSAGARLSVTTNRPPVATITSPVAGTTYQGGQTITYAGTGTDPETGALPGSAYTWEVVFHHDTHTHPFMAPTSGATGGTFVIPTIGETSANVYYIIRLTVTDPIGLSQTIERNVLPQTSTITLQAAPAGTQVTLDGQPVTTPNSVLGVVGIQRTLGVVSPQLFGGNTYNFGSWSDGGAATHTIATPASSTTYTATYVAAAPTTAPTFVQANAGTTSGVASQTVALPAATAAGDLLVVGIDFQSATFATISDAQGNTFTQVGSQITTPNGVRTRLYYAPNMRGGTDNVTVTLSGADPSLQVYVATYRGASLTAPLDVSAQSTGPAGSVSSGTATTTGPNDLVLGFCVSDGLCSPGTGFTARSTHSGNLLEDRTASTPGAYAATGTSNPGWAVIMAAFRPQGGGGGGTVTPVTASVTAANKVFDGTTTATITSCTLSGTPAGVTCSAAAATFADALVGTGKTVTATGITLAGANAALYALTSTTATTTANITAAPPVPVASVTVTPATASVVAGQTVQLTATPRDAGGTVLTGRVVTWGTSNATLATVSASGLVSAVAPGGPVTITATSEGKNGTAAITVTPRTPVTAAVTAANKVFDGTTTATITSCTLSGTPAGVTCSAAAATFADAAAGTGKTVTATGITLAGANAALYILTSTTATTTANITAASTAAPVFVQVNAGTGTKKASQTVTLPAATVAGDLLVVGIDFQSGSVSTITDTQGNTFTQIGSQITTPNGVRTRLYYAPNMRGGSEAVTVTLSGADPSLQVYVATYRGASLTAPLDVSAQSTGPAGSVSSGTATTTGPNDLVLGFCVSDGLCSPGTGFTARSTHSGNLLEDRTASTPGAYAATGTSSPGWAIIMAAFRPQGSGGGGIVTPVTASVTAANKVFDGTTAATITSCTLSGTPAGVTCSAAAATFADAVVGTGKTVTATGITLGGANAALYSLTSTTATTTANITAAPPTPVTAAVTAANKVFDGTTAATITSCTLSGTPAGVTCSAAAATFADAAVGTGKTVTATGITLGGANAALYALTGTTATTTASITAAPTTAPTFVQANAGTTSGVASQTVALPAATAAGDLLVVGIDFQSATFATISDAQGNTFTQVGSQITTPNGVRTRLYYAPNMRGGTDNVTVTLSGADPSLQVYVATYRGASLTAPLDVSAQSTGPAGSVSSGTATTTGPNDLVLGFCVSDGLCSPGTGFTARSTHSGNLLEDRTASTPGAYAATGTSNPGWAVIMAAFRP